MRFLILALEIYTGDRNFLLLPYLESEIRPTNPTEKKEFLTYIQLCCIIDIEELIIFAFYVCLFLSCEKAEENRSISNRSTDREREREIPESSVWLLQKKNVIIIILCCFAVLCGWVVVIFLVLDL
jgi:hypothetical protein